MAYYHEKADGTAKAHPHKLRAMLKNKIGDLLTRYTLDEVLSEIAAQRPTFDILLRVPGPQPQPGGADEVAAAALESA